MRVGILLLLFATSGLRLSFAEDYRVFPEGERPGDARLAELRTLNSYFPFAPVESKDGWKVRQAEIRRRILVSQGLWPEPTKTELNAVVHGRKEFDGYSVEKVYFESVQGNFVTGSLYRPVGKDGPHPAVLCPHGHWQDARFYDCGEAAAKRLIATGAERFMNAARNHIQARCVQLARMGCVAFFYDMTGNCDSIQIGHRPDKAEHLDTKEDWGFFSVQADLRLQNMMGLQTWNSIRSVDFLLELADVDPQRLGVTGASGGGTQSMILAAVDERISAAMPCVMVSTSMQGGCTCENAPLMRIGQGNIDIAAAIAPRPLALTAADDWTRELETKGYPALQNLYEMLGHKNRLTAVFHIHFPHNYNHVNRTVMYDFFNRHFGLGLQTPILESNFELLSRDDMTVWNEQHPAPSGSAIGAPHEISLLRMATEDADEQMASVIPDGPEDLDEYRDTVGLAWETILGRRIDQVGDVKFSRTSELITANGVRIELGRLDHTTAAEQLPAMILQKDEPSKGTVVWVTDSGKSDALNDGQPVDAVVQLLQSGFRVITADLSGQGEFLADGKLLKSQRMWYQRKAQNAWEKFSGYTYGYNHSLFVQRTHDVLSMIKFAELSGAGRPVLLAGLGETAGPIALAARSQARDTVAQTFIDLKGFRFADLTAHDAPMFVPGAVKYLDIDGLLSLCAPHSVVVAGTSDVTVATRVFKASGSVEQLRLADEAELKKLLSDQ